MTSLRQKLRAFIGAIAALSLALFGLGASATSAQAGTGIYLQLDPGGFMTGYNNVRVAGAMYPETNLVSGDKIVFETSDVTYDSSILYQNGPLCTGVNLYVYDAVQDAPTDTSTAVCTLSATSTGFRLEYVIDFALDQDQWGNSNIYIQFNRNVFNLTTSSSAQVSTLDSSNAVLDQTSVASFGANPPMDAPVLATTGVFLAGVNPAPISWQFTTPIDINVDEYVYTSLYMINMQSTTNPAWTSAVASCNYTVTCAGISVTVTTNGVVQTRSMDKIKTTLSSSTPDTRYKIQGTPIAAGSTIKFTLAANSVSLMEGSSQLYGAIWDSSSQNRSVSGTAFFNPAGLRTVTFNKNDGSSPAVTTTQIHAGPAALTSISSLGWTRPGFTFTGWYTNQLPQNGLGYTDAYVYDFAYNRTLYAQWSATPFTVTYNTDGGSSVNNGSFTAGGSVTLPSAPTKPGYTFAGWFAAQSGGNALGSTYSPPTAANTTIYARWTPINYSVTYDVHGGSSVTAGSYSTGGSVTLPSAPTLAGYTFDGWFAAATGGNALTSPYSPGSYGNITLHAQWTPENYTVTYDEDGGSSVSDGLFTYGGSVTLPSAPTKDGYTFDGWFAASSGGNALTSPYSPTGSASITLFARWTASNYTVTYDSHGGSSATAGTYSTGGSVTLPSAPTKNGFTFNGWFAAATGGNALTSPYSPSGYGNITLHAQWTANAPSGHTVRFHSNGGSGTMPDQTSSTADELRAETFTRNGYSFIGWNTTADGSGRSYDDKANFAFSTDEDLYAIWKEIPATPESSIDLQIEPGDTVADAPVDVVVEGLKDQSKYTITVRSTPIIVEQGKIFNSRLKTYINIPKGLEPGWHSITIEAVAADGTPWKDVMYFEITANGKLKTATADKSKTDIAGTKADLAKFKKSSKAGIKFVPGTSTLSKSAKKQLRKLARIAMKNNFGIEALGTAGTLPGVSDQQVKNLAKKRAWAIKKYLVKQGMKSKNVKVKTKVLGVDQKNFSRAKLRLLTN